MVHCYISCTLDCLNYTPKIDLKLNMSDFTLHCDCGADTTYGSMFKTEWEDDMYLECRVCGTKYYPRVHVDIKNIVENPYYQENKKKEIDELSERVKRLLDIDTVEDS